MLIEEPSGLKFNTLSAPRLLFSISTSFAVIIPKMTAIGDMQ